MSPAKDRIVVLLLTGAPWGAGGVRLLNVTDSHIDYTQIIHFSSSILADRHKYLYSLNLNVTTLCPAIKKKKRIICLNRNSVI